MHTWEDPEIYQIRILNQANQNDWPKKTRKKCPHINDLNCHKGVTFSLGLPVCLSTHTVLFFLLINTSLVSLLSVFVGVLLLQSRRARALSLTTGLVARIWSSHCCDLTSISGQEQKPCFKLLQAEATQDQCRGPQGACPTSAFKRRRDRKSTRLNSSH